MQKKFFKFRMGYKNCKKNIKLIYKFKKLNFGPNTSILKTKQDIKKKILAKLNNKLNLLIIAVDLKEKDLSMRIN